MAKHQRTRSRPGASKRSEPTPPADLHRHAAAAPAPRAAYIEALALYEQAVAAIQAHDYPRASSMLQSVLSGHPEEKELHERVRLYLNVCERHMAPRDASPSTPEERVLAATLALNTGNVEEALDHLRIASAAWPDHDPALYLLASVLSVRDEVAEAVPLLLRAIELNPDNRTMARHDPDLERLRRYDSVRAALDPSNHTKTERRRASRRSR